MNNNIKEKKEKRFSIKSINDLADKLSQIELTSKILVYSDVKHDDDDDFAGFKTLLEDFYDEIRSELHKILHSEIDEDNDEDL